MDEWGFEDILVTVRAYPEPSKQYTETSCVAGVTLDGGVRRLFPIRARDLQQNQRFKKYSVIRARVRKAPRDQRPESYNIDSDSVTVLDEISTQNNWAKRNELVGPFRRDSVEVLQRAWKEGGEKLASAPSLALIRPREVSDFVIESRNRDDWTERERATLNQQGIFSESKEELEFIPYRFKYRFTCSDSDCSGHEMSMLDWEVNQAYRNFKRHYGSPAWRDAMAEKFDSDLRQGRDLQFFLGTMKNRPWIWTIVGIYYPRHSPSTQLEMPDF